jgi:hypothetical protein
VVIPASPDRFIVLEENCTLPTDVRRGETVFVAALGGDKIPAAESLALAKVDVGRMGMIVRENEDAIAL